MKIWQWGVLVAASTFLVGYALQPPTWVWLLVMFPLFAVGFTVVSFTYSFRSGMSAEPVPAQGNKNRIGDLKRLAPELERIGFAPADEFFIKTIPDCLVHGYIHRTEPAYFCLYHFGAKITADIVSLYGPRISLTTSDSIDSGNVPRPAEKGLQIFPRLGYAGLWEHHRAAMSFLSSHGLAPRTLTAGELRPLLMASMKEFKEYVLQQSLWPLKLIAWVVSRHGRRYCRPLDKQWPNGIPAPT